MKNLFYICNFWMQTEILRSAQDDMFMLADVTNIRASDDIHFGVLAVMSLRLGTTSRTSPLVSPGRRRV
jgi:hypothetical protein